MMGKCGSRGSMLELFLAVNKRPEEEMVLEG